MFTDLKEFNYQPPNMYYDKASNEVKMKERTVEKKKKLIRNIDDLEKEKKALYAEIGLDEDGFGKEDDTAEELAEKLKKMKDAF